MLLLSLSLTLPVLAMIVGAESLCLLEAHNDNLMIGLKPETMHDDIGLLLLVISFHVLLLNSKKDFF